MKTRTSVDSKDPQSEDEKLMQDLDAIRGSSEPILDDGVPDNEKFARAIAANPKYWGAGTPDTEPLEHPKTHTD